MPLISRFLVTSAAALAFASSASAKDYFVSIYWSKPGDVCDGSQENWVMINAEPFVFSTSGEGGDARYFVAYRWAFLDYIERKYPDILAQFKDHTKATKGLEPYAHSRAEWEEKVLRGGVYDLEEQCGKTVRIPLDGFVAPKRFDGTWISEDRKQELRDYFTYNPYR